MTQIIEAIADDRTGRRDLGAAVRRGLMERCPHCGRGRLFRAYLKVVDACPVCGEDLHHQRADDAPPYITMLLVGHVAVAGVMAAEAVLPTSWIWLGAIGWMSLALALSLLVLPRVKGALVGYQWALRMHGFGGAERDAP
ncbi:MAG: DUF983 domain-containing protein [Roseiarcus sp.]|jgi:uncharacterized protein (DUF983 family)